jgi:FdhD protein
MLKATPLVRIDERGARNDQDLVAIEAPLAIRAADADGTVDLGLYLRTPGDDLALAVGMLYTEGLIDTADDIASHVIEMDADEVSASILLQLAPERRIDRDALARAGAVTTACGLCGRRRLPDVAAGAAPRGASIAPDVIIALPDRMRAAQTLFAESGAVHAAGAFGVDGALVAIAEDVGRHNAVDKLVGQLVLAGQVPARGRLLVVSGRVAYELVHKAAAAGFATLIAVGAPTSLAIQAARAAGLELIGFARDGRFNRYP